MNQKTGSLKESCGEDGEAREEGKRTKRSSLWCEMIDKKAACVLRPSEWDAHALHPGTDRDREITERHSRGPEMTRTAVVFGRDSCDGHCVRA